MSHHDNPHLCITAFRLRLLPCSARLAITFLLLTLLGGFAASATHLIWHYEKRDEQPGLTLTDFEGAYHGVLAHAPMPTALLRNHPETLPDAERQILLDWLLGKPDAAGNRPPGGNPRFAQDYDSIDLADAAPAEIIARNCVSCHSRNAPASEAVARKNPLDFFDDVRKVATSRDIKPVDIKILAASTHTHALSLGSLTLLVGLLAFASRWPRRLVGLLFLITSAALFADLAGWWLARSFAPFVYVVLVCGFIYNLGTVALLALTFIELWIPSRSARANTDRPD